MTRPPLSDREVELDQELRQQCAYTNVMRQFRRWARRQRQEGGGHD